MMIELIGMYLDRNTRAHSRCKVRRKATDDTCSIRLILLPNGMEALIIHDATTDKSSASVDVKVGHLHDPEDLPGLAHFCEHLMFMGTEKASCCFYQSDGLR